MSKASLKGRIQTAFKLHGFRLRLEACKWLETQLAPLADAATSSPGAGDEADEWLEKILERLSIRQAASELNTAVVDRSALARAIEVREFRAKIAFVRRRDEGAWPSVNWPRPRSAPPSA